MQKILVCLKRVVDYNVRIRVAPDGSGVVTDGLKTSVNPFDEIALEEALRLREQGRAAEVVVVTLGGPDSEQQLRTGLAIGADRAIRVHADFPAEPLTVAAALHAVAVREAVELVLLGKQSIDGDNNQTGQMLAALWDRPQATFASRIVVDGDRLTVTREVDAGLETLEVELPAVVTTDLRLNAPRYARLPEILKAKRKPIAVVTLAELGVTPREDFRVVATAPPAPRPSGQKLDSVAALVAELDRRGLLP